MHTISLEIIPRIDGQYDVGRHHINFALPNLAADELLVAENARLRGAAADAKAEREYMSRELTYAHTQLYRRRPWWRKLLGRT